MNLDHEEPWEPPFSQTYLEYLRRLNPPLAEGDPTPKKLILRPYTPPQCPAQDDGPLPVYQKTFVGGLVDKTTRSIAVMLYDGTANPYDHKDKPIFAILLGEKDTAIYISYLQELLAILRSMPLAPAHDLLP